MAVAVAHAQRAPSRLREVLSPNAVLLVAVLLVALALTTPQVVTIGAMYHDVYQFFDAANRIFDGGMPARDFATPVGPLGYYLFAIGLTVFPVGQPVLLAQWSILVVTAPLLAMVLHDVAKRSRATAFALLIPFLLFALLPFNTIDYYPLPGVDGFGIYNRQVCSLLYVVVAALVFVRNRRLLTMIVTFDLSALFFVKITGFLTAAMIVGFAFLAGRFTVRNVQAAVAAFALLLAGLELTTGLVGDYVGDIAELVGINRALLLPRFLQAASLNFGMFAAIGALSLVLLWADRRTLGSVMRSALRFRSATRLSAAVNHPACWLLVVLFAGLFFETQNLGSQALIFIWPVCLRVILRIRRFRARPLVGLTVAALVAAAVLPPPVEVIGRAARVFVGSAVTVPLDTHNLKSLGQVALRPDVALRVEHMTAFYPEHRAFYEDFIDLEDTPSPLLFHDPDFHASYLLGVDEAIDSIRALEARAGVRFDTIWSLSSYNVFPYLMDRGAPRSLHIAADPWRTVSTPDADELRAVSETDLVVYPTCPATLVNGKLLAMYAPGLINHTRITLDDCNDAFVNETFAAALRGRG